MPLSKNKLKLIRSLELKKKRKEEHLFIAEGPKLIQELFPYFQCETIVGTAAWLEKNPVSGVPEIIEVTTEELARASLLKTPQQVLALFKQATYKLNVDELPQKLSILLDDIQDPGNLGTIIRLADWFGIEHIVCSPGSADVYNPKVVQATMGAMARVKVHYMSLPELLAEVADKLPIYGTFLDGSNMYDETLTSNGLIVMGNEGQGISKEVELLINKRLYIPNYPINRETTESLNVAVATAVVCAEFRRKAIQRVSQKK